MFRFRIKNIAFRSFIYSVMLMASVLFVVLFLVFCFKGGSREFVRIQNLDRGPDAGFLLVLEDDSGFEQAKKIKIVQWDEYRTIQTNTTTENKASLYSVEGERVLQQSGVMRFQIVSADIPGLGMRVVVNEYAGDRVSRIFEYYVLDGKAIPVLVRLLNQSK